MGKIASGLSMGAKAAGKSAKAATKETTKEVPAVVKKRAKPGQTVSDPERMAFPGIYKRPDIIAQEAASMVAPESPSMKELFGVTRDELYDISKELRGNLPGELPGAAAKPRGSEAAEKVMTRKNTQRLLDVLSEVERFPELMKGMDSWYTMIPLYQKAVEVLGAERAKAEYPIMNALMGMASPGSAVTTEIPRGTAAYYLHKQGRFPEFMSELGKPVGLRNPGLDPEILGVPGHPYHKTAQGLPMQRFLETGEMQMESPKVPMYIEASGVPETGFQTRTPVGDAHFVRGVGLADVRTNKGFAGSITTPEMTSIAPWWREQVAGQLGIESVPAQARTWGAFAPQTGVDTPIGAPKLELIADDIMRAARRLNISPIEARDLWLEGKIRLGGDVGKAEGGSVGSPDVIPAIALDLENEYQSYAVGGPVHMQEGGSANKDQSVAEQAMRNIAPRSLEDEFRLFIQGGGGSDQYGAGFGGRLTGRKKIGKDLEAGLYVEGFGAKPKGGKFTGDVTGYGVNISKRFAAGGAAKMKLRKKSNQPAEEISTPRPQLPQFGAGAPQEPSFTPEDPVQQMTVGSTNIPGQGGKFSKEDLADAFEKFRVLGGDYLRRGGPRGLPIDLALHLFGVNLPADVRELFGEGVPPESSFNPDELIEIEQKANGGPVHMQIGGQPPMDEIGYMMEAIDPTKESTGSPTFEAVKFMAPQIAKSLVSPFVGAYSTLTSGKYGTPEGIRAGEAAMEKFMLPGEVNLSPEAEEKVMQAAKFMEELETKYKLPPLMPELFGPVTGAVQGMGPQVRSLAGQGVAKAREAVSELPPIPAGLSIQPVGQTTEQWLKSLEIPPKPQGSKMEVYAPADDLGLYSKMEKAALNFKRKEGTGDAWLADFKNAGVSDEELEFSGMKDVLARITQPMKRETIAVYAKQRRMPLQAVRATEGTDSGDFKFREAEVIDDPDYIKSRAEDIEADFDNEYPGGTDALRARIMRDFTDEELNDPHILASIDETVEANKKQEAYDRAYTEYYDNPYYKSYNDAGYEIVGNRDVGFTVKDPNGNYLMRKQGGGEEYPRTFSNLEIAESFANQHALDTGLMKESDVKFSKYQLDRGTDYEEMKIILPQPLGKRPFHSEHWDDEDVLSHYRTQRRTDTAGKEMLYVDEIQSDWHQAGRDYGYLDEKSNKEYQEILKQKRDIDRQVESLELDKQQIQKEKIKEIENQVVQELNLEPGVEIPFKEIRKKLEDLPEVVEIDKKIRRLFEDRQPLYNRSVKYQDLVPDAPFKDTWHELTVKAILHDAAQKGFERVGFSAAKPHIDRWGTEVFAWEKVPEGWKIVSQEQRGGQAGGVNLEAEARARGVLKGRDGDIVKTRDDVKRIVEATLRDPTELKVERITNKVWKSMNKTDVGIHEPRKEGLLFFYDEALKKYLQKYAKKIGAEFYETETKTGRGVSDEGPKDITEKVYMIEFTPKAKDTAIKGQPYKKGGAVKKRIGGPIYAPFNTKPDISDAGQLLDFGMEQELKRYG